MKAQTAGLADNGALYRALFDNAREAMMVLAADGRCLTANAATVELFGADGREAVSGLALWEVSPPLQPDGRDSAEKAKEMIGAVLQNGFHTFEWRCQTLGGRQIHAAVTLSRVELAGQRLIHATVRDLTHTEEALAVLRDKDERLRLAFESTGMGTYVWDHRLGSGRYSGELVALFGLLAEAEQRFGDIFLRSTVLDEDRDTLATALRASLDPAGDGVLKAEVRLRRLDGSVRWIMIQGQTGFDDGGDSRIPLRSAGIAMDITDRKRADQLVAARLRLLTFSADHPLDDLLQKTLDEAEQLSGSQIGFYHFVEDDQKTLSLQAWSTRTVTQFCQAEGKGLHYAIDTAGVWVDCVRERRPVVHNDYASLPHKKGMPKGHAAVVRELVVPIFRDGRIVAILGVGNKPTDYTEEDIRTIEYLADVAWEITRRKRAESALRDSEELLTKIFNSSSNSMAFTDPATSRIQNVNDTWVHDTGIPRAAAIGRTALDLGLWPNPDERKQALAALDRDGQLRELEATLTFRGEPRRLAINAEFIEHRRGRFLLWEFRDITEHERATREIALLKHSIDVHYDAAYWMDAQYRFVYVNESGAKVLGYRPSELIGMAVFDVNPRVTPDIMAGMWEELRRDGFRTSESVHRRKDGSEFPVEILTSYVRFAGKEYAIGFARDLTSRKHAEAERSKLQEQLAQAHKMESIGRLAGGVAHDFNNMLGVILAHVEIALEQAQTDDALRKDLHSIRSAAQRSADLTRQLLAFARKQTVAPKVLDLNQTVGGMLKMVRRLIGEDLRLDWRPGSDVGAVFMDAVQIDQILANLCVNARDAIADVGTITIETGIRVLSAEGTTLPAPGTYVWLAVNDDGCGMDEATKSQAFDPFFTTKEVGKGTGLGLATVYGIVKQNRGFVELKSEPGKGTRVAVFFPRHTGRTTAESPAAAPQLPKTDAGTVLLVEDEPALAAVVSRMLARWGYQVITALTPGQAIEMAREHRGTIDLFITDVVMPEMNGRDLAKNILSLYPDAKRLFMSGYTAEVIAHQGVLDEGVCFIQKPFSAQELLAKVREILGRTG
jgi:two-component system, cell cycle sensor histidine kinase and response regulator CckA